MTEGVAERKYREIGGKESPNFQNDELTEFYEQRDEEMAAKDLSTRQFYHCFRDIRDAIEEGCFAVETPRVYAEQDAFHRTDIGVRRNVEEYYGRMKLQGVSQGPPIMQMTLGFDTTTELLGVDIREHLRYEGPVILYGRMHLWRMDEQAGSIDLGKAGIGDPIEVTADLEWRAVEPICWR